MARLKLVRSEGGGGAGVVQHAVRGLPLHLVGALQGPPQQEHAPLVLRDRAAHILRVLQLLR